MKWTTYGVNLDTKTHSPITHLLPLLQGEAEGLISPEELLGRFGNRLISLQELPPSPPQVYARLLHMAQREALVEDILRQTPGQFVDLGEGRKVAYMGPLGDGHLRAYIQAFDDEVEWGVEVVDAPGEVYGLVLLHGTCVHLQEAEVEAIKRAQKVYQFFTLEAQSVPFQIR